MLRGEPSKMRTGKETKDVTLVLVMVLQWVPRRRGGPPIFVIRDSGVPTVNNSGRDLQFVRRAGSDEMLWVSLAVVSAPTTVDFEQ